MTKYAIQDINIGMVQWIGEALSESSAIKAMNKCLYLFDEEENPQMLEVAAWKITELTEKQYEALYPLADQAAIDYLESVK